MIKMDKVQLSKSEFKALSSDTRNQIIKLLRQRNFTLSELSQKMSLSAPTVKQHLNVLLDSGLIELKDEGRKWKYYSLSRKGKKIAFQEQTQFMIVLAVSSIAVVSLLLIFYASIGTMPYAPPDTGVGGGSAVRTFAPAEAALDLAELCQVECGDCNALSMDCTEECEACFAEMSVHER